MKHRFVLLLATVYLLSFAQAKAQEASSAFKTEALAATRQLAAFISLDDARQLPVRRLTQARLTQEADARQLYANDADMLQKKLSAIGQEYTKQLEQVLTPAQYQRYVAAAPGTLPATVAAKVAPAPAAALVQAQPAVQPAAGKAKAARSVARPAAQPAPASKAAARH
ncbi:hypothetical protein [Hymenobacter metallilatus]|uniref:DUF4168 domain-containing protein n=1 Tax=Hymenobacter metallilatus TaxID=2493666 RepID=A0A428JPT9_9BACT|nr:hypothetical protein [Hymenobacter metallilatus]RSK35354.1 hypothetical protein EI290_06545 [Hymenobacter metallilatus]